MLCLAGRQVNTNAASSVCNTVALWPKAELEVCLAVFRMKPKLASGPYWLQMILGFSLSSCSHPPSFLCLFYTHTHLTLYHQGTACCSSRHIVLVYVFALSTCSSLRLLAFFFFLDHESNDAHMNSYRGAPRWYTYFFSPWLYPPVGFLQHIEMVSMSVSRWVLYGLQRGGSQVAYLFLLLSVGTRVSF